MPKRKESNNMLRRLATPSISSLSSRLNNNATPTSPTDAQTSAPTTLSNTDTTPTTSITHLTPFPSTFTDGLPLPKLLVFDLDYTLWPFWVDTHVSAPLKATETGSKVRDKWGEAYGFYEEVGGVLVAARQKGLKIGIASRTSAPDLARDMLRLLRIPILAHPASSSSSSAMKEKEHGKGKEKEPIKPLDLLDYLQIYPGSKRTHFRKIHTSSGIPFEEMLFFDDESRNRDTESLGVVMRLVKDGVTRVEVDEGVREWRKRNKRV